MINKNIFNFLIFYFLACSLFFAQKVSKAYNFVNIKQGVSKMAVSSIIQDHYGFVWIGTNGTGLYKFDGIDYIAYKHIINDETSIGSNFIYASFLDLNNRLWVGTEEGLNLYNRELDKFLRIPVIDSLTNKPISISVRSVKAIDDNNLVIGTFGKGLFKMNLTTLNVVRIGLPNKYQNEFLIINNIACATNGIAYMATNMGLLAYSNLENKFVPSAFEGSYANEPLSSVLLDRDEVLWLGTFTKGIIRLSKNKTGNFVAKRIPFTNTRILSLIELPEGGVLCGTENDGLFQLNTKGHIVNSYLYTKTDDKSILSNSIWSLFIDANERIWLGYYNTGVGVYDKLFDKFKNIESIPNTVNSLQLGSVTGIQRDDLGRLWISMDGGGIDVYDSAKNTFTHINKSKNSIYSGLTTNYLECIFIDSKKNIWAGSWNNGLFLLKHGAKKFINFNKENTNGGLSSNTVLNISEGADGTILIGTFYKGLHVLNPETFKIKQLNSQPFKNYQITSSDIRKILVDSNKNIWLGTTQGLFKIVKTTGGQYIINSIKDKMTKSFKNEVNANHILTMYETTDKRSMWIGTKGAGLARYDLENETLTWFNTLNGLPEDNIHGILESDDKNIWVSSNSGIYKYDIKASKFTNYNYNDGLLSNDFNANAALKDINGNLYFGSYKGIDFFNPNNISLNTNQPNVYLTGFKLFNKKVMPNAEGSPLNKVISETELITLTNKQSVFTIDYSAINYTRPEKNQYAYYLEGLEDTWNYVGNLRSATYTNLDTGRYVFKLKAANNDGIWSEEPTELEIIILPPWWQTGWAFLIYALLFISATYLFNKIIRNRNEEKEVIRNERIQRVQEDKLNERKLQFFTNISHEFRTPLTLMINPLRDIINNKDLELPKEIREKHHVIYKNTDRLYKLINELMDFRKLDLNKMQIKAQELNLSNFIKEIISYFKEEAINRNIQFALDADIPDLMLWADQSMLEKIIFNIFSNAMKVTPDGGAINIDLLSREHLVLLPLVSNTKPVKVIEIIISDTGPGLEKTEINKIFERFYQVENLNKTYYGGTGIGLEVVQNFVKLHKGEIVVESKLGEGTTFRILFPASKNHFQPHQLVSEEDTLISLKEQFIPTDSKSILSQEAAVSNEKNKIYTLLIVEDNVELRSYLKNELKRDYKILVAKNGNEGLEKAREILPDAIITDVLMPEMNGFEFCKIIKTDIRTSHIPLLMLTAKTRIDDRIEGIGHGADAYMVKPFDMRLLKLRISQLITSRKLIFDKYFGAISGTEEHKTGTSFDKQFISKVLSFINANISDSDLSVELLAAELNLSRSQLYRKIKALTGQTVNEFLRKIRLQRAKQLLEAGSANVSEVCYKVGFASPSYFTKCFKGHFGILPTEVQSKNKD